MVFEEVYLKITLSDFSDLVLSASVTLGCQSTDFTHQVYREYYYSAWEKRCIMTSVALGELSKARKVTVMNRSRQGDLHLGLETTKKACVTNLGCGV